MSEIVIGIDPDSKKYGIAVWVDGVLDDLQLMSIVDLVAWLKQLNESWTQFENKVVFVVEDVKTNSFMYARNSKGNQAMVSKMAQNVGMCKHSQTVAEEFINYYGFKLIRVPPSKQNWAKDRKYFERITGWTKSSNEDNRSAAYFAFLHVKKTRAWHELQERRAG